MDNMNEVRITDLSAVLTDEWDETTEIDWCGQKLIIRKYLPLPIAVALVKSVISSCFDEDTGSYVAEIRDFAEKIALVAAYTNIDIPESYNMQYRLVYQTDILNLIESVADEDQYFDITNGIAEGIDTIKQSNKAEFDKQVQLAMSRVNDFVEKISAAIEGMNSDDIGMLFNAIVSGNAGDDAILKGVIANGGGSDNDPEQ